MGVCAVWFVSLANLGGCRDDRVEVCSQVGTIGSSTDIGTGGLQMVIPTVASVVIHELDCSCRGRKGVLRRPVRCGKRRWSRDYSVRGKGVSIEASIERNERMIMDRTVERAVGPRRPYRIGSGGEDVVGEDEIRHRWIDRGHVADQPRSRFREGRNVIDRNIVKDGGIRTCGNLRKCAWTTVGRTIQIIEHYVVNAIASAIQRK